MALPAPTRPKAAERWDPFRELEELQERFARLWQETGGSLDRWVPLADLEETDDAFVVELELPGAARDDVDVQLDDGMLTISGEIKERERAGILRRRTRKVGKFRYSVSLPGELDEDHVEATLSEGVLTVRAPKSAQSRRRRIPIGR
ncbi:Hsp20/alpha crystallin family protein [Blastococcus sp. PRF04-17]|uniref:Hsp20/alpha crystallin family protein n=1 Tax=Blastococcus sp. PRF04-17 TaxID=2933797 RepID=UPI001FF1E195|nr:Hsp20/alpha crystallin family protein [Blastococcus sp. PRF04-17]UOY02388.1 Hsp20/alpha crystallin family protein [Blastococcus sp. PRF04-17]